MEISLCRYTDRMPLTKGTADIVCVPLFTPTFVYIHAAPIDSTMVAAGAECRVVGRRAASTGMFLTPTPNPAANIVLSNLFEDQFAFGGVNIVFPACQSAAPAPLMLFRIQIFATLPGGEATLRI